MSEIICLQIDAFTDRPFSGNPAAVCFLEAPADATWMQAVAAEMNLSETAFVVPHDSAFGLRWFTPTIEVDLCGHATLAAAHALWSERVIAMDDPIAFQTRSGLLTCTQDGGRIELDFPAIPLEEIDPPRDLVDALGVTPSYVGQSKLDHFVFVDAEQTVRSLEPDYAALRAMPLRGLIVTSPSENDQFDFISRYFAPAAGIDEDPVTGSAHCCLGPFWAEQLGKTELTAFQASARGGTVQVRVAGDRVFLSGTAVTVLKGALVADAAVRENVS
ncbi:MAG: PhzF family phenazine biosynthesis protein [Gammaproteobacteria bacterium]|nr:PhzF family phenazine biosynthesis protein [Gammaproteobacteria bacterium]